MKRKIRRRCKCGCGGITNYGKMYIHGHHMFGNTHTLGHKFSKERKKKISLTKMGNTNWLGKKHSKETKLKMSLSAMGNTNAVGNASSLGHKLSKDHKKKISIALIGNTNLLGYKQSEKHKLNISIANTKYDPNYQYCDIWKDREYKKDIRKDYCENINCKNNSKKLDNHHIYLDKKRCAPQDVMTMCNSCHIILHNQLGKPLNPKNYIIINRSDHVSYIHKKTHKIIRINKRA